ncbi:MAG: hypothetical protein ABIH11_02635 [Candidatus Altiarchaeota archaeon]
MKLNPGELDIFCRNNKHDLLFYALVILTLIVLAPAVRTGLYINDESVYLLMVDSLVRDHSLSIWNGMEYDSVELEFIEAVDAHDGRLYPQYPHIYAVIASPFYIIAGVYGLFMLNLIAFCGTMICVYHTVRILLKDELVSLTALVVYVTSTYSIRFAVDLWPHSLTVFLVSSSVYLAVRSLSAGGVKAMFLAGFVSASAIGVRYQAVLFTGVVFFHVLLESKSRRLPALFMAGTFLPLLGLSVVSWMSYGSFFSSGYSEMGGDFGGYMYFQFFILAFLAIVLPHAAGRVLGEEHAGGITLSVLLAVLACFYVIDAGFIGHASTSIRVLFSEVVDISRFPVDGVKVSAVKKSLLQASPILVLAVPGIVWVRKNEGKSAFLLLTLLSFTEVLFFSGRVNQHGGLTHLMRYFLQSLPYMSVLVAYVLVNVFRGMGRRLLAGWCLSSLAFIFLPFIPYGGGILLEGGFYNRTLPLIISTMLMALAYPAARGLRAFKTVFTLFVVVSIAYGFVVNAFEVANGIHVRTFTSMAAGGLGFIREDSLVLFHGSMNVNYIGLVKAGRRVRIADAGRDNSRDAGRLADYYVRKGVPVYVVAEMFENDYVGRMGFTSGPWIKRVDRIFSKHRIVEKRTGELRVLELRKRVG